MAVIDFTAYRAERLGFTEQDLQAHLAFALLDPEPTLRLYQRISSDSPVEADFACYVLESRGLPKLPREPKAAAAFCARLRARVAAVATAKEG